MNNPKFRSGIMIAAGAYLAYIGINLIREANANTTDHYMLTLIIGAVFVGIGVAVVVQKALVLWKERTNVSDTSEKSDIVDVSEHSEQKVEEEQPKKPETIATRLAEFDNKEEDQP